METLCSVLLDLGAQSYQRELDSQLDPDRFQEPGHWATSLNLGIRTSTSRFTRNTRDTFGSHSQDRVRVHGSFVWPIHLSQNFHASGPGSGSLFSPVRDSVIPVPGRLAGVRFDITTAGHQHGFCPGVGPQSGIHCERRVRMDS